MMEQSEVFSYWDLYQSGELQALWRNCHVDISFTSTFRKTQSYFTPNKTRFFFLLILFCMQSRSKLTSFHRCVWEWGVPAVRCWMLHLINQEEKKHDEWLTLSHKVELCVQLKWAMPAGGGSGWFWHFSSPRSSSPAEGARWPLVAPSGQLSLCDCGWVIADDFGLGKRHESTLHTCRFLRF